MASKPTPAWPQRGHKAFLLTGSRAPADQPARASRWWRTRGGASPGPAPVRRRQVDPDRQLRRPDAARQAVLEQPADSRPEVSPLAVVEGLLGQPEVAAPTPADLDDHEGRRRARVDRHEVELVATDMDVPGQDGPARFGQPRRDERLGGVTRELRRRSRPSGGSAVHPTMLPDGAHPRLSCTCTGTYVAASSRLSRSARSSSRRRPSRARARARAARGSPATPRDPRAGPGRAGRRRASAAGRGSCAGGTA